MKNLSDKECVELIRRGDVRGLSAIVDKYSSRVFSMVAGIVHDRCLTEEIVSDVFFRVWDKIGSFRSASSFSTWLYAIAWNAAVSQARKRKISLNSLPLEDIIADTLSQTDQREDMLTRMERAVKSLPERDATLLRLYYYEDKSVEQCAGIMDMSIPNVKVRLHRIRTALKKILER